MAKAVMRFLGSTEEELVHAQSIRILEELGVLIRSNSVLKMLEDAGAITDRKKMIAKIPRHMVAEAVKSAPKEFALCARDPKKDVVLPSKQYPYVATNGLAVYMTDLKTGEKRKTTREDLAKFAKLADALDEVGFFWPEVTAGDVPSHVHTLHELWVSLQNGTKHVQGDSVSAEDAKTQIRIGSLVAGGEKQLRKRPIFSVVCCPIAPLSFEKDAVEGQVEFAKAGVPVVSLSMSLSGMSSPVTIAGTVVNANTENLASIVITQTASKGAPHIYSAESTPMDLSTGGINYFANECPIIAAALGQMARRYELPCMIGQWGVDGDEPGIQKSFNELATVALTVLNGTDCCSGMGGLESAKGASLEQMVIDANLWSNFKPVLRNITISEETFAFEVVKQVGQGNTFLAHPHTVKYCKELLNRDKSRLAWEATLSNKMVADARQIVTKTLEEHEVPEIERDIVKQGDEVIRRFEEGSEGNDAF
jgi:trimethylamine--corrinoid protein Co-methyltransferase